MKDQLVSTDPTEKTVDNQNFSTEYTSLQSILRKSVSFMDHDREFFSEIEKTFLLLSFVWFFRLFIHSHYHPL